MILTSQQPACHNFFIFNYFSMKTNVYVAKKPCKAIRKTHINEHVRNGSKPKSTHYQNGRCVARLDYRKRHQHTEEQHRAPVSTHFGFGNDVGTRRSAPVPSRRQTLIRFYGHHANRILHVLLFTTLLPEIKIKKRTTKKNPNNNNGGKKA